MIDIKLNYYEIALLENIQMYADKKSSGSFKNVTDKLFIFTYPWMDSSKSYIIREPSTLGGPNRIGSVVVERLDRDWIILFTQPSTRAGYDTRSIF